MKFNPFVSSSRRKSRRRHFQAPAHIRHKLMSSCLERGLRSQFSKKSLPIRKDDEVKILRGRHRGTENVKVVRVCRKKFMVYLERIQRSKVNGVSVNIGIHPSNLMITKPKMDNYRKDIIKKKANVPSEKYTEATVAN